MNLKPLTADEMKIAALIWEGQSPTEAAAAYGIARPTIYRRMKAKVWVDYMEQLRSRHGKDIQKQVAAARERIKFGFEEAAAGYLKILNESTNDFCKLKAIDSLVNLFGISQEKAPLDEDRPLGPDVYRAEWLGKPQ